ncbi:MAG: peptide-binding protein [Candidatus Rokubacteria bacterium]|nr:peptide-binding protein [Candidatus Rokubacteria bacterium]
MKSVARRFLPLAAALLWLAGCGVQVEGKDEAHASEQAGPPAYGDTFIEASIGDIQGLIPNITSDGSSHEVGGLIYDGLIKRDKDLNLVPSLAESWQVSRDCRTLTFKLRKNAKWHDGRPFTAEDVRFTYETMINPQTPTAYKEDFVQVKKLEVVDPYTLRITYAKPYAQALESWGMWVLPKHLLAPYVAGGRLREAPQNRRPIGNGAYRFVEWKSGEKVVLVANADYFEGKPYLSRVVYRIIPSQATIFLELKAKGVDFAGLTAIQFKRQTDYPAFNKAYRKYQYPGNAYTYLGFNLKDPRFADRRVRQAFAHAIDKQELIGGVLLGLGREATGPYKPGTWAYNPDVAKFPYDPDRAKQLLAEAGWKDTNGDGVVSKDGQPFAFTILTNQGNEERKKVAEIIQQRLRAIGVAVEIRTLEWASFIKEFIRKRRFEAIILGWGIGLDPDQYEIWHSSKTGPDELNHISYANPEVDRLLELGRASCRREERKTYYDRLQAVLAEDQPIIFLYFRDALPVVASRVRGIEPSPNGIAYNFIRWYVPKALQRYTSG